MLKPLLFTVFSLISLVFSPSNQASGCEEQGQSRRTTFAVRTQDIIRTYNLDQTPDSPMHGYLERIRILRPIPVVAAVLRSVPGQYAFALYTKGLTAEANDEIDTKIPADPAVRNILKFHLQRLSSDRELRLHSAALQNGGAKGFPLAHILWKNLNAASEHQVISATGPRVPIYNFTPQAVEMARVLLEYGNITQDTNVLEIGFGTNPSILKALSWLPFAKGNFVGVDIVPFPSVPSSVLGSLQLFQGDWSRDTDLAQRLIRRGPYRVIYGLDVFRERVGYGKALVPYPNRLTYLKRLTAFLEEGGRLIMMNDASQPTIFPEHEIRDAGLHIVVHQKARDLPPIEAELMARLNPELGHYRLTVLQKGKFDTSLFTKNSAVVSK